jgi:hypothetical protein
MSTNDKKVSAEDTKMTADKMAFNNKAIEAIAKNAAERDALRKKNKETSDAARARREANRKNNSSSGSRIQGLARIKNTLGRQFIGADPYDIG